MPSFPQTLTALPGLAVAGMVLLYFALALVVSLLSRRIARRLLALRYVMPGKRDMTLERHQTLVGLVGSLVTLLAFILALLATLALFVAADTLIWVIGLFSAAFGLAARSLVADVLAGGKFIFRNTFAIGEKVELSVANLVVEGTVEEVNVTNTFVRSPTGELYVVPNGDIVVIRNFSRAPYSTARLRLFVRSDQLREAKDLLDGLGSEAVALLPELNEPWQIISTSDTMGNKIELTVTGHTPYGKAASLKLDMAGLIYQRLREAGVEPLD